MEKQQPRTNLGEAFLHFEQKSLQLGDLSRETNTTLNRIRCFGEGSGVALLQPSTETPKTGPGG